MLPVCLLERDSVDSRYVVFISTVKGRNLEAGTEAEVVEEHCLLPCSSNLLRLISGSPQDRNPRGIISCVV